MEPLWKGSPRVVLEVDSRGGPTTSCLLSASWLQRQQNQPPHTFAVMPLLPRWNESLQTTCQITILLAQSPSTISEPCQTPRPSGSAVIPANPLLFSLMPWSHRVVIYRYAKLDWVRNENKTGKGPKAVSGEVQEPKNWKVLYGDGGGAWADILNKHLGQYPGKIRGLSWAGFKVRKEQRQTAQKGGVPLCAVWWGAALWKNRTGAPSFTGIKRLEVHL